MSDKMLMDDKMLTIDKMKKILKNVLMMVMIVIMVIMMIVMVMVMMIMVMMVMIVIIIMMMMMMGLYLVNQKLHILKTLMMIALILTMNKCQMSLLDVVLWIQTDIQEMLFLLCLSGDQDKSLLFVKFILEHLYQKI